MLGMVKIELMNERAITLTKTVVLLPCVLHLFEVRRRLENQPFYWAHCMSVGGIDHTCVKRPFLAPGQKEERSGLYVGQNLTSGGNCRVQPLSGITLLAIEQDFSEEVAAHKSVDPCSRSFDLKQATCEGWTIEYSPNAGGRICGVERSDINAWWHVARSAARGSAYHCAALVELSRDERLAIEVHCGPIEIPTM
ncbi:hypothetical protein M2305_000195 [Gluconobacter cerinus]|nr:hypothetical protein [Gluconobacter cerinus]